MWKSCSDDAIQWGQEVFVGVGKANFQKAQKWYKGYGDKSHACMTKWLFEEKEKMWLNIIVFACFKT